MITHSIGGTVVTGSDIPRVQILALRGALHLQTLGLGRRCRSASTIVKEMFGWKGTAKTLLKKLDEYIAKEIYPNMNRED